jgi:acyl dehydratase
VTRFWQDLQVGECYATDSLTLHKQDILDFAAEFDPQPYHLDSDAADASIFGGLCASGWQVSALMMRLLTDTFRNQDIAVMGVAAVPEMRWKIPVFAGDSLHASIKLIACEQDSGHAGMGSADVEVQVANQDNKPVIALTTRLLVAHASEETAHVS